MASHGLAEIDGGPLEISPSIWSLLSPSIEAYPTKPALISTFQKPDHLASLVGWSPDPGATVTTKHLTWTYEQLYHGTRRLAAIFESFSVPPDAVIATFVPNCAEWALFLWISMFKGITLAPLDARALEPARAEELRFFLTSLRPSVIVVPDAKSAETIDAAEEALHLQSPHKLGIVLEPAELATNTNTSIDSTGTTGTTAVPTLCSSNTKGPEEGLPSSWHTLSFLASLESASSFERQQPANQSDLDRILTVLFTSGTSTGRPKGCPRDVRAWLHAFAHPNNVGIYGADETMVSVVSTANFRTIIFAVTLGLWTRGGTCVVSGPSFTAGSVLQAIEEYNCTFVGTAPFLIYMIAEDPQYSVERTKSLKLVIVGGDVVTSATVAKAQSVFPSATIQCTHGMTEGGGVFGWLPGTMEALQPVYKDIVTCGKVLPGAKIRVVRNAGQDSGTEANDRSHDGGQSTSVPSVGDIGQSEGHSSSKGVDVSTRGNDLDEDGARRGNYVVVKRGEIGELHIGGPLMLRNYLDNVRPELFYVDPDGTRWINTGDAVVLDDDGRVYLLGRTKDIIKKAGIPIAPAALEACLSHTCGIESQIIGLPDPMYGEQPYAIVDGNKLFTKDSERLASHKKQIEDAIVKEFGSEYALGRVFTLQELEFAKGWPVNASGKVSKLDLRTAAEKALLQK